MDVTLSELLGAFMESPLVVWVSARAHTHSCEFWCPRAAHVKCITHTHTHTLILGSERLAELLVRDCGTFQVLHRKVHALFSRAHFNQKEFEGLPVSLSFRGGLSS